jgi:hypothetical protein
MARDLVWLENFSFAAWGCSACGWIMPTAPKVSASASAPVRAAFAKHNCSKFPRFIPPKGKRPARRVEL